MLVWLTTVDLASRKKLKDYSEGLNGRERNTFDLLAHKIKSAFRHTQKHTVSRFHCTVNSDADGDMLC